MSFLIFERMWHRVDATRTDSDAVLFQDLLYLGELVIKTTVAGLVAAVQEDPDRLRYRQVHRLVRADGIGEWAAVADELLIGPPSQHTLAQARDTQTSLNQRNGPGTWQYDAVASMQQTMRCIGSPRDEKLPERVPGKRWLHDFAELRNKTRGHGAVPPHKAALAAPLLEASLRTFINNLPLFSLPWAFLRRNLSGKYRISPITPSSAPFSLLKSNTSVSFPDGMYLFLDAPRRVELVSSDPDLTDFFFPNGGFKDKRYEIISYISGATASADATPYLTPAAELPPSETQGLGSLDVRGQCFTNLPRSPGGYVARSTLEHELETALFDDRHPVVTLHGPGGIGKTSLALTVLDRLALTDRFSLILWFSSRDIELTPVGPKPVRPHVLSEADIAAEYVALVDPGEAKDKKSFRTIDYFAQSLTTSPHGPTLFVFDNFETVQNPTDIYQWLNARIRLPNKILITTRFREFKGDYPVEVAGMSEEESSQLIDTVSRNLGIAGIISDAYKQDLHHESSGHPYVMKILLGEVARAKKTGQA